MSWKMDMVVVRATEPRAVTPDLLASLGFANPIFLGSASLDSVIWPQSGSIWAGRIGDALAFCGRGLATLFIDDRVGPFKIKVLACFPRAEIGAFALQGAVNSFGFAVWRDGGPLRRKAGDAESGVTQDFGDPLPEEAPLLALSRVAGDGRRLYQIPEFPEEELTEDQLGEAIVFEVLRGFLGFRPDLDGFPAGLNFKGFQDGGWLGRRLWPFGRSP